MAPRDNVSRTSATVTFIASYQRIRRSTPVQGPLYFFGPDRVAAIHRLLTGQDATSEIAQAQRRKLFFRFQKDAPTLSTGQGINCAVQTTVPLPPSTCSDYHLALE